MSQPEGAAAAAQTKPNSRRWSLLSTNLGPLLALGLVISFFAVADWLQEGPDTFLRLRNAQTIAVNAAPVAVGALGMTVIIIAGGIDLSAGTALALCATVLAWCLKHDWGVPASLSMAVIAGCLCGLVNGSIISLLRLVPFIVTLGTMSMFLGIAEIIAKETTVRPGLDQIPPWMPALLAIQPPYPWMVFSTGVWITLVLALALSLVLRYTVFGRYVFAVGSNENTARLCGVNVPLIKTAVYALGGFFLGLAGIYQFSRLSNGNPTSGVGMELKIIAAVVIGGGSLSGGRGSVLGTLTGAALMVVIATGSSNLGLSNPWQLVTIGAVIITAAWLDRIRQSRLAR